MNRSAEILSGAVNIGRWSISERESQSGITVNDAAGRSVGRVPQRTDDLDIARLIAAAPDLLAALESINGAIAMQALRDCADPELLKGWRNLQAEARAALKKARGE